MAHTFNPSTWEAESGWSLCLWLTFSTEQVSGQAPKLYSEILSQNPQISKYKMQKKNVIYTMHKINSKCIINLNVKYEVQKFEKIWEKQSLSKFDKLPSICPKAHWYWLQRCFYTKIPDENAFHGCSPQREVFIGQHMSLGSFADQMGPHRTQCGSRFPPSFLDGLPHNLPCLPNLYSPSWDSIPSITMLWLLHSSVLPPQSSTVLLTAQK